MSSKRQTRARSIEVLGCVVILLIAFFLGIQGVMSDSIRRDELTTLGHVGGLETHHDGLSLAETFQSLRTYSTQHPPLFYVVANLWGKILSYDAYIMRILPLLWGILALAVFYRLAKDVGGSHVALVAGLLMATSIFFIFYTHEIRQYSALLFWNGLVWLMYHRTVNARSPRLYQFVFLTISTFGAIYTHNTSIFLLLAIGVYHLLVAPKNKVWIQISVAVGLAGILYLPWLPYAIDGLQVTVDKLTADDTKLMYNPELIQIVPIFWGNGLYWLSVFLVGVGLFAAWRNTKNSRYVLFFFIVFIAVVLGMNGYFEFVKRVRYVIVSLIPVYLLGAIGLVSFKYWRFVTAIFIVIWMIAGAWFINQDTYLHHTGMDGALDHPEYAALLPMLEANMSTDDILILVVNDYEAIQPSKQGKKSIEEYYLADSGFTFIRFNSFPGAGELSVVDIMGATAGRKLWMSYRYAPSPELLAFLDGIKETYQPCKRLTYGQSSYLDYYIPMDEDTTSCLVNQIPD